MNFFQTLFKRVVLRIRPNDIIVLMLKERIPSQEALDQLRKRIKHIVVENEVIILENGADIKILRKRKKRHDWRKANPILFDEMHELKPNN